MIRTLYLSALVLPLLVMSGCAVEEEVGDGPRPLTAEEKECWKLAIDSRPNSCGWILMNLITRPIDLAPPGFSGPDTTQYK